MLDIKVKIAEKRKIRQEQEAIEAKQTELKKRSSAKEIQESREKHAELEMKKAFEEKRREKEQDKIAKEKIKARIEEDKLERIRKVNICTVY